MAQLQLKNLRKAFGDAEILHGIDLDIRDGEFIVFVGPSGCGKSTLLRCIAGLEDISSGELWIGEQQVNQIPPAASTGKQSKPSCKTKTVSFGCSPAPKDGWPFK